MWKKAQERFRTRSLIATIVLMVIVLIASLLYVVYVWSYTREQSYSKLQSATEETIESIEGEFRADRNMLRMIANIISESRDSLHSLNVTAYLNIYSVNSLISDIAILTPQNKVIRISGMDLDAAKVLDFEKVKALGEHISTLEKDLETEGVYDLRSFVPIRREDETIAFLYGTTTPEGILNAWIPEIYDGHADVTVVDRKTGEILIDSQGRTRENISDVDILVTQISVNDTLADAIKKGRSGYATGIDAESKKNIYYCFLPMNIEEWEMVISVPEKYVYEHVRPIQISIYILLFAEGIALVIYFLYIIHITTGSLVGIERRANMDALTGLQNRNRYEYFCQHLQQGTEGIACIYFDVNGLHELNNTQGHLAGDNMLKTIANIISTEFGENNTYRIGGDEFVAFRYERDEALVRKDLAKVEKKVIDNGYHVACGLAMATPDKKLLAVIKLAEEEMYENKRKYYESIGKEMRG
ncbi:GGDEF domain-containing protein [Butyrivibrio sp. YAB3001]|uniref:GGDEF domain-containing protein n=1 Tax=Butyrivibrio sp. YAB3001 TaxID=1520812 RepID=UPI0008F647D0|nr:diguanylate cyclase [Butyrivibrio sp. YAB3001]SFC26139.1 diguanylate cyclase (GGDEF) domain-containing protein [Butyrivibrio sp. YAB3001]